MKASSWDLSLYGLRVTNDPPAERVYRLFVTTKESEEVELTFKHQGQRDKAAATELLARIRTEGK